MANTSLEQHFHCCICLDIYSHPVSLPCAHNFCLECIKGYWDSQLGCMCPLCKRNFISQPELTINKEFEDMIKLFIRPQPIPDLTAGENDPNHGDAVLCNVCVGSKSTAKKSCLTCQMSYCNVHLASHQRIPALKDHRLTDPTTFPNSNLCQNHNKPLDRFCKRDLRPVCEKCSENHHRNHEIVPMREESKRMRASLKATKSNVKKLIQSRRKKAEDVKQTVEQSKKVTKREIERSSEVCRAMIGAIERRQEELVEELQARQAEAERRAKQLLLDLEQEISDLAVQHSELHHLEQSRNSLHLLQSLSSVDAPPLRDWTEVIVHSDNCMGTARRFMETLADDYQQLANTLSVAEADMVRQYTVDVTLDPATASGWLDVSSNGKNVSTRKEMKRTPAGPQRFDSCVCVLAKECFPSGRHYWEVQVGNKSDWDLGVARKSINRTGKITIRPEKGFWSICRRNNGPLSSCTTPSVTIPLQESPKKVGVFLDYEEGLVSFYNANTRTHIYTLSGCSFTEAVLPYFNPCVSENETNSVALMICPVETSL